jgi:diguanylate cyclase (GGDEF)-like protein
MSAALISTLMTHDVHHVPPEAGLDRIVGMMRDERISCIVVTRDQRPVGIISERDVVRILGSLRSGTQLEALRARDVMTPDPVSVSADSELGGATELVRSRGFRRLPVVDRDGRLVGIVTQTDLLRGHVRALHQERDALEATVAVRTAELQSALERVRALSLEDGLLGIGNRRALEIDLAHTHATAQRYGRRYSVALFDVDHFKQYNDSRGHTAGDQLLRGLASSLRRQLRAADRLYRYGGDELLLLLPETDLAGAQALAGRMVEAVAQQAIPAPNTPDGSVTLSGGVAELPTEGGARCWEEVVQRADAALYRAKQAGRNRVARAEHAGS